MVLLFVTLLLGDWQLTRFINTPAFNDRYKRY